MHSSNQPFHDHHSKLIRQQNVRYAAWHDQQTVAEVKNFLMETFAGQRPSKTNALCVLFMMETKCIAMEINTLAGHEVKLLC